MKLLVSPIDIEETREAIEGGADIIDVKNPREGSLGANFPWMIREVKSILPRDIELSATLGDLEFKPGTASLAAYGLGNLGVDYIKAGLYGIFTEEQALEMAGVISRSVGDFGCGVVLAGYADFRIIGSIDPMMLPKVGHETGAKVVMMDTAVKDGKTLLDHISLEELGKFVNSAHSYGLKAALAGSLGVGEIRRLRDLGADIVGVRSSVCSNNDRVKGRVSAQKVRELKEVLGIFPTP
ncbi:MAG: (5-formylfuran-3-yl)methyl phosphate synthase [Candidatus Hydrothermarchaeales archaeon]